MEFDEGPGEAVGTFVPVFHSYIDDLFAALGQLRASQGQSPQTDVLSQRVAAQQAEYSLEMEGRGKTLPGDFLVVQFLRQMRLNIVDGIL